MAADKSDSELGSALWTAAKDVPSLVVLVWLWRITINYGFGHWQLLAAFPRDDQGTLASIFAMPLALITYYLGNVWDDRVFYPLYGVDPRRRFRGRFLDSSRRPVLGLLPAGNNLELARNSAMDALRMDSEEGLYQKTKKKLQGDGKWTKIAGILFLSKLCRSLIWPCFLVAAALFAAAAHEWFTGQTVDSGNLPAGALCLLLGLLLFVPYLNTRIEHMIEMYEEVGNRSTPHNRKGGGRRSKTTSRDS